MIEMEREERDRAAKGGKAPKSSDSCVSARETLQTAAGPSLVRCSCGA